MQPFKEHFNGNQLVLMKIQFLRTKELVHWDAWDAMVSGKHCHKGPNTSPSRAEDTKSGRPVVTGSATIHIQERIQMVNFYIHSYSVWTAGNPQEGGGRQPSCWEERAPERTVQTEEAGAGAEGLGLKQKVWLARSRVWSIKEPTPTLEDGLVRLTRKVLETG